MTCVGALLSLFVTKGFLALLEFTMTDLVDLENATSSKHEKEKRLHSPHIFPCIIHNADHHWLVLVLIRLPATTHNTTS